MLNNRTLAAAPVLSTTLILAGAFLMGSMQTLNAQTSTAQPPAPPVASAPPAPSAPTPTAPSPMPNAGPPPPPTAEQTAPSPSAQPPAQQVQPPPMPQGMQQMPPNMMPPPPPVQPPDAILYKSGRNVVLPAQMTASGVAAIVNGEKITVQELLTTFLKNGGQPTLTELITSHELAQAAQKANITVSATEIDSRLQDTKKQFTAHFPGKTWAEILSSKGLSEDYARNQTRLQLLVEKLALAQQGPYSLADKIHIYHILIATVPLGNQRQPHTDVDAKKLIDQIRSDISSGKMTFQAAAKQFSDDFGTATKGGDLGWVSNQDPLDQAFKDAAFALKNAGDISQPIKSQFGYHIILLAKFGNKATAAEAKLAGAASAQQRAQPLVSAYMAQLQAKAHVQDLLIPIPPAAPVQPMIAMPHVSYGAPKK